MSSQVSDMYVESVFGADASAAACNRDQRTSVQNPRKTACRAFHTFGAEQVEPAELAELAATFEASCQCQQFKLLDMLPAVLTVAASSADVHLSGVILRPAVHGRITPIHRMRVVHCALAASLQMDSSLARRNSGVAGVARPHSSGLLTVDQSRALVPLECSDPLVRSAFAGSGSSPSVVPLTSFADVTH
jgi:hypothetical protein